MEKKKRINIVTMWLSELTPADYNPRKITSIAKRGLRKSIQTFGYVDPIIWNKRTGNIMSVPGRAACQTGIINGNSRRIAFLIYTVVRIKM